MAKLIVSLMTAALSMSVLLTLVTLVAIVL